MYKRAQQLITEPDDPRPHIVLLGAGASRAAFPDGERTGKQLPLMDDFVDIVGLRPLLEQTNLGGMCNENFETIYSQLVSQSEQASFVEELERCIEKYFSSLLLPGQATIYDRLLVSLRPKDAIFTFNWDPFLFDAYQRNRCAVPLPEIFFLHGNVRIGACPQHGKWGARGRQCPDCHKVFSDVPLLYPVANKNYSRDPHIKHSWDAAKEFFRKAFTLTIFGYSAPDSDEDAVNLLTMEWLKESERIFEHIEVIDITSPSILEERWEKLTPTHHCESRQEFKKSRIANWPRRSCESLSPSIDGIPCDKFPLPETNVLSDIQAYAANIARYEQNNS